MIEPTDVAAILRALRAAPGGTSFFLVGAFARDLRLNRVSATQRLRQTKDVDFAVMVADLASFQHFRAYLLQRPEGDFTAYSTTQHKLVYKRTLEVDLVPFGGISGTESTVSIPPDTRPMTVTGFADAYRCATELEVAGEFVQVVTLSCLVALKLMAWNDNSGRTKDAEDIAFVLENGRYADLAENENRLWSGDDADLANEPDFDYVMSSARLLGRDIARSLGTNARQAVEAILTATNVEPFALAAAMRPYVEGKEGSRALQLLKACHRGMKDTAEL